MGPVMLIKSDACRCTAASQACRVLSLCRIWWECSLTPFARLNSQGSSRSRAKPTAGNQSHLTWDRPTLEGSVPLQCPPSTLREIITGRLRPNPNGTGKTDHHPQVSRPASAIWKKCSHVKYKSAQSIFTLSTPLLSLRRIHAVPLQPADYAHPEQHTTHVHCLSCHTEPAGTTAAATSSWSPRGPAACMAVSAVGAIWDPVWQRRLSTVGQRANHQKRSFHQGSSVHPPFAQELTLLTCKCGKERGGG